MASGQRPSYTARPGEALHVFRTAELHFAIGNGRLTIAGDEPAFIDAVTRDIGRLAHAPDGEAVLQRGDALGHPVKITKPDPPTEPPNAWILPDDIAAATSPNASIATPQKGDAAPQGTGAGCGSTIVYNPADWPRQGDPDSPTSADVLVIALRQANTNAEGRSNPSAADWGNPMVRTRR
jgi:hypothetical protein